MIYHKYGELAGQPKGFAFVTFKLTEDAESFMQTMDGKLLGSRILSVKLAHNITKDEYDKPIAEVSLPVLGGAKKLKKPSREAQIKLIESKLKKMAENNEDLESTSCQPIFDYRHNINARKNLKPNKHVPYKKYHKPYGKRL